MTFSATPFQAGDIKTLRASLAFSVREEDAGSARLPPRLVMRGAMVGLAALIVAAVACTAAGWAMTTPSSEHPAVVTGTPVAAPVPSPAPTWIEVIRPFAAYDLAGGPFAKLPLHYTARRLVPGSARQDVLTYGAAVPGQSFLQLSLFRHGSDAAPAAGLFLDTVRLAADSGLAVTRSGLATRLQTRFGRFELAGVTVGRLEASATCLAFRAIDPASQTLLGIGGLACGSEDRPVDVTALACTIEKIDLVSAGDDEDLRAFFESAERRRGLGCGDPRGGAVRPGMTEAVRPGRTALKGSL